MPLGGMIARNGRRGRRPFRATQLECSRVGGKLLAIKYGDTVASKAAFAIGSEFVPQRVRGFIAQLMVSVYDAERQQISRERSYSIDIWNDQEEMASEDIKQLFSKFREASASVEPLSGAHDVADMTKGAGDASSN